MTSDQIVPEGSSQREPAVRMVGIGSSAGGVTALCTLLGALPADFPVPIVIVQHLDPRHETVMAQVLSRKCALSVTLAKENQSVAAGWVYVAPPNHHLLVANRTRLTLSTSDPVHFVRPSADLLFESMAATYGASAIACVLTGTGVDGAMGASVVKARGGTVISQDPDECEFAGMPTAAIRTGAVDHVVGLDEIAGLLVGLVRGRETA